MSATPSIGSSSGQGKTRAMSEPRPPYDPDEKRPLFFEDEEGQFELLDPYDGEGFGEWVERMPTDDQYRSMQWALDSLE